MAPSLQPFVHVLSLMRSFKRIPIYCLTVVSVIALSVGSLTPVFAFTYGILVRPLPYQQPNRLVLLFEHVPQFVHLIDAPFFPVNGMHFVEWCGEVSSFSDMALLTWHKEIISGPEYDTHTTRIGVAQVWPSFLSTFGLSPQLGRDFEESESDSGKGASVLISARLWRETFGSDFSGGRLFLYDRGYEIVGVLPDGFTFADTSRALPIFENPQRIDILWPFELYERNEEGNFNWWSIGRLETGVNAIQAKAELDLLCAKISTKLTEDIDLASIIQSLHEATVNDSKKTLLLSFIAVEIVLLIGCINLACRALNRVRI